MKLVKIKTFKAECDRILNDGGQELINAYIDLDKVVSIVKLKNVKVDGADWFIRMVRGRTFIISDEELNRILALVK